MKKVLMLSFAMLKRNFKKNVRNKISLLLIVLSISSTEKCFGEANYVYHEATTNNPGCGVNNYRNVLVPNSGQAMILAWKIEFQFYTTNTWVYYTTDGSSPTGANGVGTGTTLVVSGSYSCTFGGPIVDVATGTIPAQAPGVTVKYIISAKHSGGGLEIFANGCGNCGTPNTPSGNATVFTYTVPNIFYSKSSAGNLDFVSNWTNNSDGTANVSPANFTANNVTYYIQNIAPATIGSSWTVSGSGSKVVLGDGTNACNFTIPGGAAFTGTIDVSANATLTIQNTTIPTLGTLHISSTVNYAATGAQNITSGNYGNLILSGSGTKTLGGAASVAAGKELTVTGSTLLNTNGQAFSLKSDATGTARIASNTSGIDYISGDVTVERWIPQRSGLANGGRAYRLITPTVSGGTINANWQEGLMNTIVGTNIIPAAPFAQYGVQITGSGGNTFGFDVTQNNQASLYTTTNGAGPDLPYTAVANTSDLLDAKKGYFLYIRGDRSSSMQIPYNPAGGMATTSTTLRAKGIVQQGTVNFPISSTAGHFSMVTNPYASVIDWQAVSTANPNIATSYTMWDPNVSTEGGFVVVTYGGTPTPGGSSAGRYIQPGQAFLVQTISGSSINITEAMKVTGNNNNGIFRLTPFESFGAELYFTEANNNIRHSADGILVKYGNGYNTNIDGDDYNELSNWYENIAIDRSGALLSVEARPVIITIDTIPLRVGGLRQTTYEWVFTPSMFTNTGLKAELIDNFLNTRTILSVTDSVVVPFSVTANPASSAANRFKVVFGPFGPLAIDVITIKAQAKNNGVQVDWTAKTEQDMDRYELERLFNGTSFSNIKTTASVGNSTVAVNYSWLDVSPQVGNNFYRIKAIDKAGLVKYTSVVKVGFGKTDAEITVSPNPVTGNSLSLKLTDLPKGSYTLQLFNSIGQQVLVSRFTHTGGPVNQPVSLSAGMASGTYRLVLHDGETRYRTTVIKN